MPHYYDMTEFPKLFKRTYWGNFQTEHEEEDHSIFFKHRNDFVRLFNITRQVTLIPQYVNQHLQMLRDQKMRLVDHVECYYTREKYYVLVVNPYCEPGQVDYEQRVEAAAKVGFQRYKTIYNSGTTTFIAVVMGRHAVAPVPDTSDPGEIDNIGSF